MLLLTFDFGLWHANETVAFEGQKFLSAARQTPLIIGGHGLYYLCSLGNYGDKRARNTRIGPGGGTRRLHQISRLLAGGWGRNRIDGRLKVFAFARLTATVIGVNRIIANNNYAPVAVAA
jgi:hypothetical protein